MAKLTDRKRQDLAIEATEAMRPHHVRSQATAPFSFIASGPFSGTPEPCQLMECRINRVTSVARFAALYGDMVLLGDPFEQVFLNPKSEFHAIADLIAAVDIMHMLRPAIAAGLVRFCSRAIVLCKRCNDTLYSRRREVDKHLLEVIASKSRASLTRAPDERHFVLNVCGGAGWIEHESIHYHGIYVTKALRRKLGRNKEYVLTASELKRVADVKLLAATVSYDIAVQERFAQRGYTYLTEREIDFEAISQFNDEGSANRRRAMLSGLQHALPGLANVPLSKLIKLRQSDGESFAVYRDSLRTVLDGLSAEKTLTVSRVREAVADAVQPEINRIKQTIRENRRALWISLKEDVLFGAFLASCGIYAGQLSPTCGAVMTALGGIDFARRTLVTANKLCKEPDEIRKSQYYYLWKATN